MPRFAINPQRELRDASTAGVIAETDTPRTRESLASDLSDLGVALGDRVIVHTSMRSLGWVNGGPVAFIQALQDAVGSDGSIVMATQSGDLSDPGDWRHPVIPADWVDEVKRTMPAYDPAVTPTWRMGAVPELFRTMPGVVRSNHPSGSFAAWGADADRIVANHRPQRIGEESPAARLYDLDGRVLLVGVGYDRNTCFHLSEYRSNSTKYVSELMPLVVDSKVEWTEVREIEFMDDATLSMLGADFESSHEVVVGKVGSAECRLFSVKDCVDFGTAWLDLPE
ncbi:MAG: AAC(3) family N-acetyltransferase [Dehalococcoidia bacterium]